MWGEFCEIYSENNCEEKNKKEIKSSWNYRIVNNNGLLEIREVYYKYEKIVGYSEPVKPYGTNKKDLEKHLNLMKKAINKSIINLKDIE